MYDTIWNPINNTKINIHSKEGRKIIHNYILFSKGGAKERYYYDRNDEICKKVAENIPEKILMKTGITMTSPPEPTTLKKIESFYCEVLKVCNNYIKLDNTGIKFEEDYVYDDIRRCRVYHNENFGKDIYEDPIVFLETVRKIDEMTKEIISLCNTTLEDIKQAEKELDKLLFYLDIDNITPENREIYDYLIIQENINDWPFQNFITDYEDCRYNVQRILSRFTSYKNIQELNWQKFLDACNNIYYKNYELPLTKEIKKGLVDYFMYFVELYKDSSNEFPLIIREIKEHDIKDHREEILAELETIKLLENDEAKLTDVIEPDIYNYFYGDSGKYQDWETALNTELPPETPTESSFLQGLSRDDENEE